MLRKILLFYCTLLALFINISGLSAARHPQDYLLQAVFLPVTLFLIHSSIQLLISKKNKNVPEIPSAGKPAAAVFLLLFLLLIAFLARLTNSQPQGIISPLPDSGEVTPSVTPTPTTVIPQKVIITTENPSIAVNIREKPASSSAILAKIKSGAVFPCSDAKEGWYQIKLENNRTGWVYSEFVKPAEEKE